ncbi:penicillin acylase family protein [Polynucleobacter victoriensis]|uniref:penicillin acylase family protein n=1 Tax=Polynucleobacter victoriensis TaxID=2049319 RepID=UPI000B58AC57|nr:penicillin acylase family protein [Polynucleobacter victoriensis]
MSFTLSSRDKKNIGWTRILGLAIAVLLIITLTALSVYWLSTKDKLNAELIAPGINNPVTIKFDDNAIPHISANNLEDAWYTLGFLHATERPWQMEFNRRLASGKLSEILGPETVGVDKFIRTLGIRRAAEKQYENYPIEYKRQIQSYVEGVNAGFSRLGWALPAEFMILGAKPGTWGPADSVAWSLMMALDLGGNWHKEFLRLELSKTLDTDRIWQVLPPYPGETPPTSTNFAKMYRDLGVFKSNGLTGNQTSSLNKDFLRFLPGGFEGIGSNNWVLSGDKTVSGKPLLANDPHLGLTSPAIWYFAHIEAPKLQVIGATVPGIPGVVLGRNTNVAWGFTNTDPDVQDLYIEALDEKNPARYQTPNGFANFVLREETILVKGKEPVRFLARETRHGPVISDAYERAQKLIDTSRYAISMRWTALDDANQTLVAGFLMNQAQNIEEFKSALKHYYAPMQNVVMADKEGQIAYRAAGVAPKRSKGHGLFGSAPALGWDKQYDWGPYLSLDQLPKDNNPSKGWIATANHRVHAANDPNPLTADWHMPYRQNRIEALLLSQEKHDLASMKAMQADALSLSAIDLLPLLQQANSNHKYASDAKGLIASFNGNMSMDSAGATIYNAWAHQLTRLLFEDKLGKSFATEYGKRDFRSGVHHVMELHLAGKSDAAFWCDQASTTEVETCEQIIDLAFTRALDDLTKQLGGNPQSWTWGKAHIAVSEHRPMSKVSWLKRHFEVSRPMPGDGFTINVGFMDFGNSQNPYTVTKAASMRAVYDLADLDKSQFIYQTGQSGWINNRNYSSYANKWAKHEYLPLTMNPSSVSHTSVLKPDPNRVIEPQKKKPENRVPDRKR